MYIDEYDIDVTLDDFEECKIPFGTPAMSEGELIYDRWNDLGLVIALCPPRTWEDAGLYGYRVETKEGQYWGKSRILDCESFEEAFELLCDEIEERANQEDPRYRCEECGGEFYGYEIKTTEVRENWGDEVVGVCPKCGAIAYEGLNLITKIED